MNDSDFIYNWRNDLKSHSSGMDFLVTSEAENLKLQGYNKSDIIEVLAAKNYDLDLVIKVASNIFPEQTTKIAQNVNVVPSKYNDVKPVIENSLNTLTAKEFVKRLTSSNHAIVKVSNKSQIDSWVRMAEIAKSNSHALETLHSELKPWVEEALLQSVLIAEKAQPIVTASNNNRVTVQIKNYEASVDLNTGTSDSEKYQLGNYKTFGLADEFMITAEKATSPYEKLKKALS
jgi:hypothetical protein